MLVKIDKAGRMVVPKRMRDRLGLKTDAEVDVVEQPEGVLLRPVQQRPSMIKIDGLWVHQGTAQPGANWDRVLEEVRAERDESVSKE